MADPAAARRMAEAGRRRVELLFSTGRKVECVENLYQELMAAHRRRTSG
jgi:hypothetical protein